MSLASRRRARKSRNSRCSSSSRRKRLGTILVEGAIARRRRLPEAETTFAAHAPAHAVHFLLHAAHLGLPAFHAVSSATHPTAPYREGQKAETDGPPNKKAQDRRGDPGRPAVFVDSVRETSSHPHGLDVNVNNIHITVPAFAVKPRLWVPVRLFRADRDRSDRQAPPLPTGPRRHRQRSLCAVAACEQRGDAVRECPDMQRHHQRRRPFAGRQQRRERLAGPAHHREGAVAGRAKFRIDVRAECRPRTSPNRRRVRHARRRDRPCRAARRRSCGSGLPSSQAVESRCSNCSKPRCATSESRSSRSR